ncbi:Saccharopine dehydrogenase-domain-containing protein [Rostrohypoxylon terebratum]|nr:Saccharopine dehydrogenase-domain-containing protein [Rostrohypoxylon terebratum]
MDAHIRARRNPRKHDILLLGATGYTGALTAEHIVRHLPTDLKWAIAGRSRSKLEVLAEKLKDLEPSRRQPDIETLSLDDRGQLDSIIQNSKVCISVVLYWRVGREVVESCVKNGTDYIDVAGDITLLRTFIDQYHEAAVNAGVALIHLCGLFAAPQDLLTWAAVRKLAREKSRKTKEVILSVTELKLSPSGGTVDSMMTESTYDPEAVKQARQPWALSPIKGTQTSNSSNFLSLRRDPVLGLLSASSLGAAENRALVHRTWGLLRETDQAYGSNFQYNEYNKVSSTAAGVMSMLTSASITFMMKYEVTKRIAKLFLPNPGDGPDIEEERRSRVKFEAVAVAESDHGNEAPRAYASFSYPSGGYLATALFLAHGAASLLYTRNLEGQVVGGCLTPAFLGDDLLSRVQAAGATFHVTII